jgi:hypothetical protein
MKTLKNTVLIIAILFSAQIFAQNSVYAVVSKAKWCPTCQKNEARIGEEVLSKVDASNVTILVNDLSDKETKAKSAEILKENGLENLKLKATGIITFIDASSKKVISSISVAKPSDAILEEFSKFSKSK